MPVVVPIMLEGRVEASGRASDVCYWYVHIHECDRTNIVSHKLLMNEVFF